MEEQTHSAVLAGLFQVLGSTSGQDVACHDLLSCFLRPSPLLEPIETFGWDHGSQNISRAQLQSPLHLETVWSSSLLVEASGQNSVWCPFLAGSGTGGGVPVKLTIIYGGLARLFSGTGPVVKEDPDLRARARQDFG